MQYDKGAIGAICGGTFLLAQTGLIDGKTATTHWRFAQDFKRRYPQVKLKYSNRSHSEQLAGEFGMSRRTFERRFKKATGHTPVFYLQLVRVKAAKQMLITDYRSFDEIAYKVVYEDRSFFPKVFIKHTGLSPSEYKTKFHRECM